MEHVTLSFSILNTARELLTHCKSLPRSSGDPFPSCHRAPEEDKPKPAPFGGLAPRQVAKFFIVVGRNLVLDFVVVTFAWAFVQHLGMLSHVP